MAAVDLTLLQVTLIAAAVDSGHVLGQIELQHAGHTAGKELPIMAHQYDPTAQVADEGLQPVQSVEIEIVGGFVEQNDVEPRQHQCRQSDPRRLPARQGGHRRRIGLNRVDAQSEVGQHGRHPFGEIGRPCRQPMVQCGGVDVGRVDARHCPILVRERFCRRIHRLGRCGAAGAPGDVGRDGLPWYALMLLRQPADEGVGGGDAHGAVEGLEVPSEDPQQGALARAVGAHHADDITRRHRQV